MPRPSLLHPAELLGLARLGVEAVAGTARLVETVQQVIATRPLGPLAPAAVPVTGIARLVHLSIHGVNAAVGGALDLALRPWLESDRSPHGSATRETLRAVLNGVLGDHLERTGNPLAIPMRFRRAGHALALTRDALHERLAPTTDCIAVLVHGLCMHDGQWSASDGASGLERQLQAQGWSTLHLHYNSGLHISTNGRAFAAHLDALLDAWPLPVRSLAIVAHSMGGLVARSACHYAAQERRAWIAHLRRIVFLGTPHHGAPLERAGNRLDRLLAATAYTAPFARLGHLRSAGITDLRHGYLRDEDWRRRDRFAPASSPRVGVPLPQGPRCYAIAGRRADAARHLLGDGLVPVDSALGRHAAATRDLGLPARRTWIAEGIGHLQLLHHPAVHARVLRWLAPSTARGRCAPG